MPPGAQTPATRTVSARPTTPASAGMVMRLAPPKRGSSRCRGRCTARLPPAPAVRPTFTMMHTTAATATMCALCTSCLSAFLVLRISNMLPYLQLPSSESTAKCKCWLIQLCNQVCPATAPNCNGGVCSIGSAPPPPPLSAAPPPPAAGRRMLETPIERWAHNTKASREGYYWEDEAA